MSKRLKALEAKLDARKRKAAYLLVENELRETGEKRTQEDIAEEIGVTYKCLMGMENVRTRYLSNIRTP
jgi:DNA-binding XRE family transcriptional regulator